MTFTPFSYRPTRSIFGKLGSKTYLLAVAVVSPLREMFQRSSTGTGERE